VTDESGPQYEWRLRELMALKGMWHTSKLVVPLAARGIELSRSQVFRLVSAKPGRVTIPLLLALCDILDCRFEDLVVRVEAPRRRRSRGARQGQARAQASRRRRGPRPAGAARVLRQVGAPTGVRHCSRCGQWRGIAVVSVGWCSTCYWEIRPGRL
jgi:DNA-binding Xre family transcriptional regulator